MDGRQRWLAALDAAQQGLLRLLDALGLADTVHGQPAWPFAHRLAIEVLALDASLSRALAWTLAGIALALVLGVVGAAWRRGRVATWAGALLLLAALPWPDPDLWLVPAVPSSFHASPTRFAVDSIAAGRVVYEQRCAACHGAAGAGDGPQAGRGAMWPPDLGGALLGRRRDGELLWTVLHGAHDRRGRATMPGFGDVLEARHAWAVLDWLQANAAGQGARRNGRWLAPIALPDAAVRCRGERPARTLHAWPGQRLRIVAADGVRPLREDPRFVTVALAAPGTEGIDVDCRIEDPAALEAFARIGGIDAGALGGTQFLVDRDGWLRARSTPGRDGWSDADLLCRAPRDGEAAVPSGAVGIDALIARMESEPVGPGRARGLH